VVRAIALTHDGELAAHARFTRLSRPLVSEFVHAATSDIQNEALVSHDACAGAAGVHASLFDV